MADCLTPKQEAFAQAYVETGNASEAYRRAYDAQDWKQTSVVVNASKLLAQTNVSLRVAELRGEALERHEMTVEVIAALLHDDRDFAREVGSASASVAATTGLAKLYGLGTDKLDLTNSDGTLTRAPVYKMVDKDNGDSAEG